MTHATNEQQEAALAEAATILQREFPAGFGIVVNTGVVSGPGGLPVTHARGHCPDATDLPGLFEAAAAQSELTMPDNDDTP
jgi:hypothetical protein